MASPRGESPPSPIPERLRFRPATSAEVDEMTTLANEIEELVIGGAASDGADASLRSDLASLLERWHAKAHRTYEPVEFKTYYGAVSTEEFVRDALAPASKLVGDLTFTEARDVLDAICKAALSGPEMSHFLDFLEKNLPGANVSDLIYWPNHWFEDESLLQVELSAEQMLGYAMQRSGRRLTGAPDVLVLPYPDPRSRGH